MPRAAGRSRPRPARKTPREVSIEDYGVIGDLHTVALAGRHGSIDWFCYPHFDSPSIFGALLDVRKGGHWTIAPPTVTSTHQVYVPDTNVLITRFLHGETVAELTDYLPISREGVERRQHRLVRRLRVLSGRMAFDLECQPRFEYGKTPASTKREAGRVRLRGAGLELCLTSDVRLRALRDRVRARFTLEQREEATFVLMAVGRGASERSADEELEAARGSMAETVSYWRTWISQCQYAGRWREQVKRSALVLKMLMYRRSGAMVAAPTTSLPEELAGSRNWDYRYTWFRDAAFVIYAMLRIGFTQEAGHFIDWVHTQYKKAGPTLRPLYTIEGGPPPPEQSLTHLAGYRGSRPVRIGNAAAEQSQLDVYGAVLDAIYLYNKHGSPISDDVWSNVVPMLDWLCEHWDQPDRSIWEVRGPPQHFVYSRVMCWVAFDRGIRLAEKRGFPGPLQRWRKARDAIYRQVMDRGWDPKRGMFIQSYETPEADASLLMLPLVFFVSPEDPKMLATIDAIRRDLAWEPLVRRYHPDRTEDGLEGREGAFTVCSFWLVEALTRAGRIDDARELFEKMLRYANPLGLYSEEALPDQTHLGNFPQALTHLALISAAYNLDRRLRSPPRRPQSG